jgi:hypothetical protein
MSAAEAADPADTAAPLVVASSGVQEPAQAANLRPCRVPHPVVAA